MNELELESELRKLRPAAPSRALEDGIAQELAVHMSLAAPPQRSRVDARPDPARVNGFTLWLDRLLWSGLGAATAMLALMMISKTPQPGSAPQLVQQSPPQASTVTAPLDSFALQPVLASEENLGWRDEGVRFDAHGQPMLKLSRTAVERQAWADLQNAGVIQMEQPRQEVLWMPVTVQ